MTFEGQQMQGSAKIMEKFGSLTFQKIAHLVKNGTKTDNFKATYYYPHDCSQMFQIGTMLYV
jgi:hypothetical protein